MSFIKQKKKNKVKESGFNPLDLSNKKKITKIENKK